MLLVRADPGTELRACPRRLPDDLEGRLASRFHPGDRDPALAREPLDDDDAARMAWPDRAAEIDLAAPAEALERDRVLHEHDRRRLRRDAGEAGLVGRLLRRLGE